MGLNLTNVVLVNGRTPPGMLFDMTPPQLASWLLKVDMTSTADKAICSNVYVPVRIFRPATEATRDAVRFAIARLRNGR